MLFYENNSIDLLASAVVNREVISNGMKRRCWQHENKHNFESKYLYDLDAY